MKSAVGRVPWSLPVLLAVTLVTTVCFHGSRGLYESTEGRYAECGREMLRAGEWLEPRLDGHLHWTKPPLTYWAIRAPCAVLGPTTWAARLYLIPCHLLAVAAVWWLSLRVWRSREAADLGAVVYATMAMVMMGSQIVSTDYLLTAAIAAAYAFLWEVVRERSKGAAYGLWLTLGLAFLIKGPPALLVLPSFAAVWFGLSRDERKRTPLFAPLAVLLFLAVALSWYMWESSQHPGLLSYWMGEEVVNRSLSDKFNRNPSFHMNLVIYVPVLVFGTLPWSGWLAWRWREAVAALREAGFRRGGFSRLSPEVRWLVWSTAFPLAVFFVSRSKLPLYVLPLFVPLAVGAARLLMRAYAADAWFWRRALPATAGAAFALFVVGKAVSIWMPSDRNMARVHRALVERCGLQEPGRLATTGKRPMSGLSYYYDCTVTHIATTNGLGEWAAMPGNRYLLVSRSHEAQYVHLLAGRAGDVRDVVGKWRLIQVVGPALQGAAAGEEK